VQRLIWEPVFQVGLHTYPSRLEGGQRAARDVCNMRVDKDGYLQLRYPVSAPDWGVGATISGVAVTQDHIWWVGDNFYFKHIDNRVNDEDFRFVEGADDVSGRLSVLGTFRDYVVVSGEGGDKGYWIDVRDDDADELDAFSLGLDPPDATVSVEDGTRNIDRVDPPEAEGSWYIFCLTYVRAFWDNLDTSLLHEDIANKEFTGRDILFNGIESNPGMFFAVHIADSEVAADATGDANFYYQGEAIPKFTIPVANGGVKMTGLPDPDDDQITGFYVYRSAESFFGRVASQTTTPGYHVEVQEFHVIDYIDITHASATIKGDSGLGITHRASLRFDNHRLPDSSLQLAEYNTLFFAAVGDELRYCDLRSGVVEVWAWPEANSIKVPGRVEFCTEYRGVLLFGSRDGIWRLTGVDEYSFEVDRISSIGPVTSGAYGILEQGVGFIHSGGFHVTDGVQVQKVSSPVLDAFFERSEIVDGAVGLLPNNDIMWACEFADDAKSQFLQSVQGGWFLWSDISGLTDARQFATVSEINTDGDEVIWFLHATGRGTLLNDIAYLVSPGEAAANDSDIRSFVTPRGTDWAWESQELDFGDQGFGDALKTFKWLEVMSSYAANVKFHYWLDDDAVVSNLSITLRGGHRPTRIPIQRMGTRFRFRINKWDQIEIRGMRLVAETRASAMRY